MSKYSPNRIDVLAGPIGAPHEIYSLELGGGDARRGGDVVLRVGSLANEVLLTFHTTGVVVQRAAPPWERAVYPPAQALTWAQLARFAETGELSTRAYGIVCDGTFRAWYPSRRQAEDMAADLRASYGRVELVEIDPDLAARLAK